jgi:hypothetical protein
MVFEAGESYKPMTMEEQREAIEYAKKQGFSPLFPE